MSSIKKKKGITAQEALDKAFEHTISAVDKAEQIVITAEEKIEAKRRRVVKSEADHMSFGDNGTESIFFSVLTRTAVEHGLASITEKNTSTFVFFGEDEQPLYTVISRHYRKQNLVIKDAVGKTVGKTVVKGTRWKPCISVYENGVYRGDLERTPRGDNSGIYMMGDLRIKHSKLGRFEITNVAGSLIANESKHRLHRCIVFHEGDDSLFIAILYVCAYVINFSHGEVSKYSHGG